MQACSGVNRQSIPLGQTANKQIPRALPALNMSALSYSSILKPISNLLADVDTDRQLTAAINEDGDLAVSENFQGLTAQDDR